MIRFRMESITLQSITIESVIREMKEETGLTIENPIACGFKDWIQEDGTRYLVLLPQE